MQETNTQEIKAQDTKAQEIKEAEDQSADSQGSTKTPLSFPEPPISEHKALRVRGMRWKVPAWLWVCAGVLAGLVIGVLVMHQRAVSRSIIVSVNGTTITQDQLLARIQGKAGAPAIHQMVQDELQLQFAQKKSLAPTDAEVDAQYAKMKQRPNFDQVVASSGLSEADVKHSLRVEMAQTAVITQGISVTDEEARRFYQAQSNPANPAAQFYQPPAVSLRAIATLTEAKSRQALVELAARTPFELAASSYSVDQSKQNGGLLTPLVLGRSPLHSDPALEQRIFAMKVGDQIGPVFFAKQWWIFQCQDKIAAKASPYEQVKDQCLTGAKLLKGKAVNGARIQTEFAGFQRSANLQAFWPQYQKAIAVR